MFSPHVHIPYHEIGNYLSYIRGYRPDIEIYFPASDLDAITDGDIKNLKEALDYNPSLSFHAPFMDLSPGAVDSKIREVTMGRFTHIMDIAEILSPKVIVFHSGYEKWRYAQRVDIWLEESIKTWRPLIERASRSGIKIAIENIFEDEPSNLVMLMKELGSVNFGLCFDAGHCNLFSKVPMEQWLQGLKKYIIELHIHDNDGTFDSHLPIGDGNIDFKTLFSILKDNNCLYTIEAHTPEDVLKSMQRLKESLST